MARKQRDVRLQTREARRRLEAGKEPIWHEVRRGLALGYYRGARGGSWWLREYRGGRYWKRDIGVADDAVDADGATVLSWEQALKKALGDERPTLTAIPAYTVNQALTAYWAKRKAKSPAATVEIDKAKAEASIVPKFGTSDANTLTSGELRRWRDGLVSNNTDREIQRRQQATANRTWTIFRAALNMAYTDGNVTLAEAWRKIKPFPNVDRARTRSLSAAEAKRLLNASPAGFRRLVRGALYTGLRLGELLALTAADAEDGRIVVRHSKSGKSRTVPLNSEGKRFFEEVTAGLNADAPIFQNGDKAWHRMEVSRRMAAACNAAEVSPPATFHDLRRSYGSLLINAGMEADVIGELLGHADLRMTKRAYAHLLQSTLQKQVDDKLPGFGFRSKVRKLRP
jgi:integrase